MRTFKPLWQEGLIFAQHHFQQQDRWWEFAQPQFAPLTVAKSWGALSVDIDSKALELGRLKLERLKLRSPADTPIDTSVAGALPPARDLSHDAGLNVQSVIVFAALPRLNTEENNCQMEEGTLARGAISANMCKARI